MIVNLYGQFTGIFNKAPLDAAQLFARLAIAPVFWLSGRTKVDGFSLKEEAVTLFEYEYQLPIISPVLAAYLATIAEHALPILLVLGLFTRAGALGLLIMTLVIQFLVYPGAWAVHSLWFAVLFFILIRGPGAISLDHLIFKNAK